MGALKKALNTLTLRKQAQANVPDLNALMLKAHQLTASIADGTHTKKSAGQGEKFWQFRDYDPADRPQDIDWRRSARGDKIFIRQKEQQQTQTVGFWCQTNNSMCFNSKKSIAEKRDTAMTITLALAILTTKNNDLIRILGSNYRPGRTEKTLQNFGQYLIETPSAALPPANIKHRGPIILIGDFLSPIANIEQSLNNLLASGKKAIIIQIFDPAELDLPYKGRAIFQTNANDKKSQINDISSIKPDYQKRIQDHINNIKTLCQKHGAHYIMHVTNQDIRQTLSHIIAHEHTQT